MSIKDEIFHEFAKGLKTKGLPDGFIDRLSSLLKENKVTEEQMIELIRGASLDVDKD
jgi:hypothetical protein